MKIQAKAIQCMEGMDGYAFRANIYVDGYKVGHVHDEGCGGELMIEINKGTLGLIEDYMNTLPNAKEDYMNSVDVFLSDLVLGELDNRDIRKALKKPQFIKPNDKAVYCFPKMKWTPETKVRLEMKYPSYFFINNLPFDEAKKRLTVQ